MRWAGFLGCLLLIASYGFQGSFQIGLQVPLRFDSEEKSEKFLRIATFNVALSAQQPNGLKHWLRSTSDLQLQNIAAILQKIRPVLYCSTSSTLMSLVNPLAYCKATIFNVHNMS